MAKIYEGKIPFEESGDLVRYAENWRDWQGTLEWRDNKPFNDDLQFLGFNRGRSAAYAELRNKDKKTVYMFLSDIETAILENCVRGGHITGSFVYCKKGSNYGIKLWFSEGK